MPTHMARETGEEEFGDEVTHFYDVPVPERDYFSAYNMGSAVFNPDRPLSEFSTGLPRFKSAEELEGRIKNYFETALKRGQPLTVSGMASSIGTNREQFLQFKDWYKTQKTEDDMLLGLKVSRIITGALAVVEQYSEEKLYDGKMKPQAIIFSMVNNFGWRNKLDVEATSNSEELGEIRSAYRGLLEKQKTIEGVKPEKPADNPKEPEIAGGEIAVTEDRE